MELLFPSLDMHDLALVMAGVCLDGELWTKSPDEVSEAVWEQIKALRPTVPAQEQRNLDELMMQHRLRLQMAEARRRNQAAGGEQAPAGKDDGTPPGAVPVRAEVQRKRRKTKTQPLPEQAGPAGDPAERSGPELGGCATAPVGTQ